MSGLDEVPVGAVWRCADLHLHTPAVRQFRLPEGVDAEHPEDRSDLVRRYVDALESAGIELGAITDYQGVREPWFSALRAEAATRGITLLPGAELSLAWGKGLHLLLITDPTTGVEDFNGAIRHLGKTHQDLFGDRSTDHGEIVLRDSLEETLRVCEASCRVSSSQLTQATTTRACSRRSRSPMPLTSSRPGSSTRLRSVTTRRI